jgi:Zn-dependent M28 family amino/carboxypeptidase
MRFRGIWWIGIAVVIVVTLAGCEAPREPGVEEPKPLDSRGISDEALRRHLRALASDELEGRAPGSEGEEKTVGYLTDAFQSMGLSPGNPDGTFVQSVPLVGITPKPEMSLSLSKNGEKKVLAPGDDYVAFTKRVVEQIDLDGELVFVGYGAVAAEYQWDDFKDVDVRDKVLLFLVNDPPVENLFGGKAMTYYGRWTYKFETAAARGAAGALVIHETGPAGYPWGVVGSSPYGESFDLATADKNMGRARVEGWIQRGATEEIFRMAGLDFEAEKEKAATKEFRPVSLGIRAQTSFANSLRNVNSRNVLARVEGAESPDEVIIYTAHWDHLGKDESLTGDKIYNGAYDNASGTAALLEIAANFGRLSPPPRRSVLFLAVTAEEQGLLGSRLYASNPLYPLEKTVAVINMDGVNVWGRTNDLTVVGMGQSTLDDLAARMASEQGRVLKPDAEPEKGFYYRSDHFEFAKVGVPSFDPDDGVDFLGRPEGWGIEAREKYTSEHYHQVSDEVRDDWDLSGMVEDCALFFRMGQELASGTDWPEWSATSEFRAKRQPRRD